MMDPENVIEDASEVPVDTQSDDMDTGATSATMDPQEEPEDTEDTFIPVDSQSVVKDPGAVSAEETNEVSK
jgi:hypothetical protein